MIFVLTSAARVTMRAPHHCLIFQTRMIWSLGHLLSSQGRLCSQLALGQQGGREATHQSQAMFHSSHSKVSSIKHSGDHMHHLL
jgi:hypothetical protein